jgi:hypothetical protein
MKQTANKEHGKNWWVKQNTVAEHKHFQCVPFLVLVAIFICDVTTLPPEVLGFHTFYTRHETASVNTLTCIS